MKVKDFFGVWTALVTPFRGNRVSKTRIADLVEMAVNARITGVVPLGSTGEASALEDGDRDIVVKSVVDAARGRIRVMVGAGTNNMPRTVRLVKRAADLGADAVLVVAPYYNKPTPEGLKRHFLTVADKSPLPIILYHIPSRCGVGIPLNLVVELAAHPRIFGIKEAGGDVYRSGEIARLTKDNFAVLSGDDPLTLSLMSVGAVGVISVISNIAPKTFRRMVDLCLADKYEEALVVHRQLAPLLNALSLETNPAPIKEAMNILGMNVGTVWQPLARVRPPTRRALKKAIEQLGKIE